MSVAAPLELHVADDKTGATGDTPRVHELVAVLPKLSVAVTVEEKMPGVAYDNVFGLPAPLTEPDQV